MSLKPRCLSGCSVRLKTLSRRGHWHHYWVGPRDGDRELILKWVAPMFINSGDNIVTIYPVKAWIYPSALIKSDVWLLRSSNFYRLAEKCI